MPQISAFDPTTLYTREVVDDAHDRQQATVRPPASLGIGQPIRGGDDLLALPLEKAKQEVPLVG